MYLYPARLAHADGLLVKTPAAPCCRFRNATQADMRALWKGFLEEATEHLMALQARPAYMPLQPGDPQLAAVQASVDRVG